MPLLAAGRAGGDRRARACDWPDHVFVQISEAETGRAVRTHRWKYGVTAIDEADPRARASAEYASTYHEVFLYDLYHDPYELENLVDRSSHAAVRARMRSLLLERIRSVEGREPRIVEPELVPGGQRVVAEAEVMQ